MPILCHRRRKENEIAQVLCFASIGPIGLVASLQKGHDVTKEVGHLPLTLIAQTTLPYPTLFHDGLHWAQIFARIWSIGLVNEKGGKMSREQYNCQRNHDYNVFKTPRREECRPRSTQSNFCLAVIPCCIWVTVHYVALWSKESRLIHVCCLAFHQDSRAQLQHVFLGNLYPE